MRTVSAEIVPPGPTDHIHDAHDLAITTITRAPKGEAADAYRATARDGAPA